MSPVGWCRSATPTSRKVMPRSTARPSRRRPTSHSGSRTSVPMRSRIRAFRRSTARSGSAAWPPVRVISKTSCGRLRRPRGATPRRPRVHAPGGVSTARRRRDRADRPGRAAGLLGDGDDRSPLCDRRQHGDRRLMAARRPGRVLVLGCGSVSQCTLPLLIRDLEFDPAHVTVVDFVDNRARIADVLAARRRATSRIASPRRTSTASCRHASVTATCCSTWRGTSTAPTILQWCRDHGVRYLNTSVEVWDPYDHMQSRPSAGPHAVRAPHGSATDDRRGGARTTGRRPSSSTAPTPGS